MLTLTAMRMTILKKMNNNFKFIIKFIEVVEEVSLTLYCPTGQLCLMLRTLLLQVFGTLNIIAPPGRTGLRLIALQNL